MVIHQASAICRHSETLLCMADSSTLRPIAFDTRPVGKERYSLGNTRSVDPLAGDITSMARIAFEIDHHIRRLRFVGLKALRFLIDPTGEIHHNTVHPVGLLRLDRLHNDGFHNIEAIAVEKVSVIAEQPFELRHQRMLRWKGLGLVLMQSLSNLCGIHLHRTAPLDWISFGVARAARPPTREWSIFIGRFRYRLRRTASHTINPPRSTRMCGIWLPSPLATDWQRKRPRESCRRCSWSIE